MLFSITDEIIIFLFSCLSGVLVMLFYDILSVAVKTKECSIFVLNIYDGIFIITACAIIMFVNFYVTNGIIRGFEFVGTVLGALIYKLTLSHLFSAFFKKITGIITSFFKIFFKILLTPIEIMYKIINKYVVVLLFPIIRVLKKVFAHVVFKARMSIHTTRNTIRKM